MNRPPVPLASWSIVKDSPECSNTNTTAPGTIRAPSKKIKHSGVTLPSLLEGSTVDSGYTAE